MQTKPAPVDSHKGIWCRWGRGKTVPKRVWPLGVDNSMPATCCSVSCSAEVQLVSRMFKNKPLIVYISLRISQANDSKQLFVQVSRV